MKIVLETKASSFLVLLKRSWLVNLGSNENEFFQNWHINQYFLFNPLIKGLHYIIRKRPSRLTKVYHIQAGQEFLESETNVKISLKEFEEVLLY